MKQISDTEARREYYRKWRAKNRDKIHTYNKNYWIKRAEKAAAESEVICDDDNVETGD